MRFAPKWIASCRKAAHEVFPAAAKARTPIVAFTAIRWGTLLEPCADTVNMAELPIPAQIISK
jgi:hypothetical protein